MNPLEERFLIAVEFATYILIGIAIGEILDHTTSVDELLFRWSTLLAGFLAVGAAAMTVRAMMRVDKRQQTRHDDLVKLTRREDTAIVARAGVLRRTLKLWIDVPLEIPPAGVSLAELSELHERTRQIRRMVQLDAFEKMKLFLNDSGYIAYELLKTNATVAVEDLTRAMQSGSPLNEEEAASLEYDMVELRSLVNTLMVSLHRIQTEHDHSVTSA